MMVFVVFGCFCGLAYHAFVNIESIVVRGGESSEALTDSEFKV